MASIRRTLSVAALSALAVSGAAGLAAPAAFASSPPRPDVAKQMREVCAKSVYVKKRPAALPVGSVFKGEEVNVVRIAKSGRYAQIVASRPAYTVRGWVPVRYLCAEGQHAEFAKTSRYSVRVTNSLAGGDPGFLYVGGPANITVKDNERAGQTLTLCVTPAPEERPSCRTGRTGRTMDTIVWSQGGATELRIAIDGGPVLVDTVYPYAMPVRSAG